VLFSRFFHAAVAALFALGVSPAAASEDWASYGHDLTNQRYSSLKQVDPANVGRLVPAFVFQTGVVDSFETTPLVAGNTMFLTAPHDHVFAVDARTGKRLWHYEHKLGQTAFCCGPVNRGVALLGDLVYLGTLDGKLVALDRASGKVRWQAQVGADPGFGLTMAPLVYKDEVIVGGSGGEFGVRGTVSAYDAKTGARRWRWYATNATDWAGHFSATTPDGMNLHRDLAQEKADFPKFKDAWKKGGGTVWMTPAADPAMNAIFFTTGNPAPDVLGKVRPGDNLHTNSIVALDASTGKLMWYNQLLPHDLWDLDLASPVVLFDTVDAQGKPVKAVGEAGKSGWFYVVDRTSGKFIRKSKPFVPQENMFAQPTAKGVRMAPGVNGGSEWSPVSFDPALHYAFVSAINQPVRFATKPQKFTPGVMWLGGTFHADRTVPWYGLFSAIDVDTGEIAWQAKTDQPLIGGALSTAGGLTFFGEGNGMFDAYDSKSGKLLWQFECGAGVNAAPMAYEVDGEEYVAVAAGGSFMIDTPYGDSVYVFKLPKS
jgi:alcohol dehydrogenase (cytochrome c)